MEPSSFIALSIFYKTFFCRSKQQQKFWSDFDFNHHIVEVPVIWLIEQSTINLLISYATREKQTLSSREVSMQTLNWWHSPRSVSRSLFFDVEKRRQYSEVTTIAWDL